MSYNGETLNTVDNKRLLKSVLVVAGPIALQSLIASSLNLVDNLMIGALGELALNAVGVSVQLFFIYWMFVFGFVSGSATFMAQFFGVRDFVNIRRTTGFALCVVFGMGVVFFLMAELFPQYVLRVFTKYPEVIATGVPYIRTGAFTFLLIPITQSFTVALRATQQTHLPLIASVIGLCMNTFMNYCLIYGHFGLPRMEVRGAALATVIARVIELGIILFFVFGRGNMIKGPLREFFSFGKHLSYRVFRNSLPTTINETLWSFGTSLYIAAFARISITAGAAVQACNTINGLFSLAAFSVGDAVLILVGQKLGENKKEEAYDMAGKMLALGVAVGLVFGGLTALFGHPILSLFDFTEEGAQAAWQILIVYAATLWLDVYTSVLITGVLRCGGDTRFAMFTEVGVVWLFGVPVAFITSLVLKWPIFLAVLSVRGENVIKGIILTLRFKSRKWLNNVIDGL